MVTNSKALCPEISEGSAPEKSPAAHKPEFLWNPTRDELITTKFMRNRVLFSTLADHLIPRMRQAKGAALKILFWGCSTGCEPYSLKFLLGTDSADEITGVDFDSGAIQTAREAIYPSQTWTMFFEEEKKLLESAEVEKLFEPVPPADRFRVREAYRKNVSFLVGDLFSPEPVVPFESFDVVICNNLLIHMKPHSANVAWDCLHRYVTDNGLIVVGGCNPKVRMESVKRLSLHPRLEAIREISRNWSGVSGAWNFKVRPAWAYPMPDENHPDFPLLAGEIFAKGRHKAHRSLSN